MPSSHYVAALVAVLFVVGLGYIYSQASQSLRPLRPINPSFINRFNLRR